MAIEIARTGSTAAAVRALRKHPEMKRVSERTLRRLRASDAGREMVQNYTRQLRAVAQLSPDTFEISERIQMLDSLERDRVSEFIRTIFKERSPAAAIGPAT